MSTIYASLQKHSKSLVALFFVLITVVGLCTVMDYGRPWDEIGEINILRMALMEYGEILPFETNFHQSLTEMGTTRLSESIERDHGTSMYYLLLPVMCRSDLPMNQVIVYWRMLTWLIFVLGCYALYAICRRMRLSRGMSILAPLFLLLSPRFFADAHYNNKDIVLMVTVLVVIWQALRLTEKPSYARATVFAIAAAFCISTRIIGAAVCGLFALLLIIRLILQKELNKKTICIGLYTLALAFGLYVLLMPSFLADPLGFIEYVVRNSHSFSRWNGSYYFMGKVIDLSWQRAPFYYLPVTVAVTTPIWLLILLAIGQFSAFGRMIRERFKLLLSDDGFTICLSALMWMFALLGCIVMNVKVYNSWRHVYFLYGPMVIMMVYGYERLWRFARKKLRTKQVFAGVSAIVFATSGIMIAINHPLQFSYYNALIPRTSIAEQYDLDYWNLSVYNALNELMEQSPADEVLRIKPSDQKTKSGVANAMNMIDQPDRFELLAFDQEHDGAYYLVANTSYAALSGWEPTEDMREMIRIESYRAPLTIIYTKGDKAP